MRMLLIAVLAASAIVSLRSAELTTRERSRLVAHLEMTGSWLTDEVSTLSQEQLVFRPTSAAWSIMEVLEHLIVVGPIYWNDLQKALQGRPSQRLLTTGDADILWYGIDRTRRETAIPSERPPGRLRDIRTALEEDPYTARAAARLRTNDERRSPEPCRGQAAVRCLPVGAAHLDARTAACPSDPGNQGPSELPGEVGL